METECWKGKVRCQLLLCSEPSSTHVFRDENREIRLNIKGILPVELLNIGLGLRGLCDWRRARHHSARLVRGARRPLIRGPRLWRDDRRARALTDWSLSRRQTRQLSTLKQLDVCSLCSASMAFNQTVLPAHSLTHSSCVYCCKSEGAQDAVRPSDSSHAFPSVMLRSSQLNRCVNSLPELLNLYRFINFQVCDKLGLTL